MWLVTVHLRAFLLLSQVQVDSCNREWRVKLCFIYISFHLTYLGVMVLCWGQCYKLRFNLAKPDMLPGPIELGLSAWKWKKMKVLVTQSCPTLCNCMDCSPPGSSVNGSLQASILEWEAVHFSRGSSTPRNRTWISCIAGGFFVVWTTREAAGLMWGQQTTAHQPTALFHKVLLKHIHVHSLKYCLWLFTATIAEFSSHDSRACKT